MSPEPHDSPNDRVTLNPDRTHFMLTMRHVLAIVAFVVASVGFAVDIRSRIDQLGLRLDGLGDSPGLSSRLANLEGRFDGRTAELQQMAKAIASIESRMAMQVASDEVNRRVETATLMRIEEAIGAKRRPR